MNKIVLLDMRMAGDGHRNAYTNFFSRLFELNHTNSAVEAVLSPEAVLVPMVEDSFGKYVLIAVIRALLGKRTSGLLFRPLPAIKGKSLRLRLKYWILRLLRATPGVSTLTILPFSVEPRFSEIARSWIYDPQLWDLDKAERTCATPGDLATSLATAANGRRICVALGRQDTSKGFDWFVDLYERNSELRQSFLFAFGGKVHSEASSAVTSFAEAGGYACNRFITDEELLDFYASADLIWCAYAADYDQASGIFGRAVQLGIPVIVRRGSLIHFQCELEHIAHIAISDADEYQALIKLLQKNDEGTSNTRKQRMREKSLSHLNQALGF